MTSTAHTTGGPDCTLRDAISAANLDTAVGGCPAGEGADVIVLPEGVTIALDAVDNDADGPNALPSITSEIAIRGNGAVVARASGAAPLRLFHVEQGGDLRLEDLTVRGGLTPDHDGGAVRVAGGTLAAADVVFEENFVGDGRRGGAVHNEAGKVTLERVTMLGNAAPGEREVDAVFQPGMGSAVANVGGELRISESEITDNGTYNSGEWGVIAALGLDALTVLTDTRVVDNFGLGVFNQGELRVSRSELSRNASAERGGVVSEGVAFIVESTFVGGDSEPGNGVSNTGFMRLRASTIADHRTAEGFAGLVNDGIMELLDSVVSGNSPGPSTELGGGITNRGRLTLVRTEVSGNSAEQGGGIRNDGELYLIASTVADNEADRGGGVYSTSSIELLDEAVVGGNGAASSGGGLYFAEGAGAPRLVLSGGSAVRGNVAGLDGGGVFSEGELAFELCPTCLVEENLASGGTGGGIHAPDIGFGSIYAPGIRANQPNEVAPGVLVSLPISASTDDAEEAGAAAASPGTVEVDGRALHLGHDPDIASEVIVGLRFQGVPVPAGATLVDARIVFTAAAPGTGDLALLVGVQDSVAPAGYAEGAGTYGVSARPTIGSTYWPVDPWEAAGDAGPAQATPSLRNQVQQLVDAPGWAVGNATAFVLSPTDAAPGAARAAHAHDGDPALAPRLWLLYYEPEAPEVPEEPADPGGPDDPEGPDGPEAPLGPAGDVGP